MSRHHEFQISKEEGDRIAADVLRLVKAVLADTQNGPVLDRIGRSPLHDEIFGCAPSAHQTPPRRIDA